MTPVKQAVYLRPMKAPAVVVSACLALVALVASASALQAQDNWQDAADDTTAPGPEAGPPAEAVPPPPAAAPPPAPAPQPRPYSYGPPPARAPYQAGAPPPRGARVKSESDTRTWISGLITFTGVYLATFLVGSIMTGHDDPEVKHNGRLLMIPCVGPFLLLPDAPRSAIRWLVISGVLQSLGLIAFIVGVATRQRYASYAMRGPAGRPLALAPEVGLGSARLALTW
jgi:hypothetical protein